MCRAYTRRLPACSLTFRTSDALQARSAVAALWKPRSSRPWRATTLAGVTVRGVPLAERPRTGRAAGAEGPPEPGEGDGQGAAGSAVTGRQPSWVERIMVLDG